MRINIGPYREWLGPYQVAKKVLFWMEEGNPFADPEIEEDPRIHQFGEFLAHGFQKDPDPDGEDIFNSDKRTTSWFYKLLLWIESKKERKVEIEINKYDTWGMDHTMAMIIAPMLKQLKETKHSYPAMFVQENEDHTPQGFFTGEGFDLPEDYGAKEWDKVLDKMIWAFDQVNDDEWEEQYSTGTSDLKFEKMDEVDKNGNAYSQLVKGPNDTRVTDYDGIQAHHARMQEGFDLFGKHFRNLWD